MSTIQNEHFASALKLLLKETFYECNGYYLDKGDSLFETLADVSAEEASIPVGGKCATLSAQVKHVAFYMDVLEEGVRTQTFPKVDWNNIWETVNVVTEDEWQTIQGEVRQSYDRIVTLIDDTQVWPDERALGGAMALIVHSAYHLGEIKQALCTLKK